MLEYNHGCSNTYGDRKLQDIEKIYDALMHKIPVRSVMFTGTDQMWKAEIMNQLYKAAESKEILCKRIAIKKINRFVPQIISFSQEFLNSINGCEYLVKDGLDTLETVIKAYDQNGVTYPLSTKDNYFFPVSLTQALTDLFVIMGKIARKTEAPICLFIDDIHCMKSEELGALIAALHRSNQLGYPLMIIGTALPKILKMMAKEKSYAERLFQYIEVEDI